jgi:hypothetical protein
LFSPHPNLSDEVNHHIVQSEIEGGVFLNDLPSEAVLQIRTQNHCYTAVLQGGGCALISGHPSIVRNRCWSQSLDRPGEAPC